MAGSLKDECGVLAGFGGQFRHLRPDGRDTVMVRKAGSAEDLTSPSLDLLNTEKLTEWARWTCVPMVSWCLEEYAGCGSGGFQNRQKIVQGNVPPRCLA